MGLCLINRPAGRVYNKQIFKNCTVFGNCSACPWPSGSSEPRQTPRPSGNLTPWAWEPRAGARSSHAGAETGEADAIRVTGALRLHVRGGAVPASNTVCVRTEPQDPACAPASPGEGRRGGRQPKGAPLALSIREQRAHRGMPGSPLHSCTC